MALHLAYLLCLWVSASLAQNAGPFLVEIGILFPKNTRYNAMTSLQVIFALQDHNLAAEQFISFAWEMYQGGILDYYKWQVIGWGGLSKDDAEVFRETSSAGITILAGWKMYEHTLAAASYCLIWKLGVYACDSRNGDRDKRSGETYFTVVDDNSGQNVAASDCLDHVATMVFAEGLGWRTQYGHVCYDYIDEAMVVEPAPCRASLTNPQIKCLESYFAGQSNMDVCMAGFETVEAGDDSELLWPWANETSWSGAHAGPM